MSDYEKLLSLIEDDMVQYGVNLPSQLHKKLCLGQTRYVCRYGTLSDGHEKITPAQRYFQAIREIYYISNNIKEQRAIAMEAKADELDASVIEAHTESQKLRKEAALMKARNRLTSALVTVQDQMRMLDEYNKVRQELEAAVEAQYPEGIEQAEEDSWRAVFEYRMHKERLPGVARQQVDNIPLAPKVKAALGDIYGRIDAVAPLMALASLESPQNTVLLDTVKENN